MRWLPLISMLLGGACADTNLSTDANEDRGAVVDSYRFPDGQIPPDTTCAYYSEDAKRLVLFITDGGFSCTSVSSPTRPGYSDGLCPDWEYPDSVISLLGAAHDHPTTPVSTFIVGVPGSDSTASPHGFYATAPYHMRLALSAYAYAGSPSTVDPLCDGRTFTKTGGDPTLCRATST